MMLMVRPCLVLGLLCLLSSRVSGYQLESAHWSVPAAPVWIICPEGMPDGMVARIHDAAALWDVAAFHYAFEAEGCIQQPGVNYLDYGPLPQQPLNVPAQTTLFVNFFTGTIAQCVIRVRSLSSYIWYTGTGGPPVGSLDVWTIVGHEMGHCAGLGHSDDTMPPALMASFYVLGSMHRYLSPDDEAGLDALYGQTSPDARGTIPNGGGCAMGSQANVDLSMFFLAGIVLMKRWICRLWRCGMRHPR